MSAMGEILARVQITRIAEGLGVKIRHGRCVAPWRRADGWNVSLNDAKGTWFDHARGEGGGLLDFVARVRGGDRKAALEWLAAYAGVALEGWSEEKRREWGRRMEEGAQEAAQLVAWRDDLVREARERRDIYFGAYHRARKYLQSGGLDSIAGSLAADVYEACEERYQALDSRVDEILGQPWNEMLVNFRAQKWVS